MEENASLFADDTTTPCDFNITNQHSVTENVNDTNIACTPKQSGIHSQCKHKYRNTFGESNIQYHNFDNQDSCCKARLLMGPITVWVGIFWWE